MWLEVSFGALGPGKWSEAASIGWHIRSVLTQLLTEVTAVIKIFDYLLSVAHSAGLCMLDHGRAGGNALMLAWLPVPGVPGAVN